MVTFPDEGWQLVVAGVLKREYLTADEQKGLDKLQKMISDELDSMPTNEPELAAGRAAELLHYSTEIEELRRAFGNVVLN